MTDIQIILEPCKRIYHPGDNVNGYVLVNLSKEKKANKICFEARGRAQVVFWHGHGDHRFCYRSEKNEVSGEKSLPSGSNKYLFSFAIPHDAAPSLKGTHGHIRYRLKAELDLPWALNKHCQLDIIVGSPVDLNSDPTYVYPQTACIHSNTFSSILTTVSIPRLIWSADEVIPVHCNITNNSSHGVSVIEIAIVKKEIFKGKTILSHRGKMIHECIKKILSMKNDICVLSSTTQQVQVDVPVPSDLVTFTKCPIMSITYELVVKLHLNSVFSSCPSTSLPVILSNVPLVESSRSSHIENMRSQPSLAFLPPYFAISMFPAVDQNTTSFSMSMAQSIPYSDAPPSYSLYISDPSLETSSSDSNIPPPYDLRPRCFSVPAIEYKRVPFEIAEV